MDKFKVYDKSMLKNATRNTELKTVKSYKLPDDIYKNNITKQMTEEIFNIKDFETVANSLVKQINEAYLSAEMAMVSRVYDLLSSRLGLNKQIICGMIFTGDIEIKISDTHTFYDTRIYYIYYKHELLLIGKAISEINKKDDQYEYVVKFKVIFEKEKE